MANRPSFGHLAPFLQALKARSGLTVRALAAAAGLDGHAALGQRLRAPGHLGLAGIEGVARSAGATPTELARVRVLDALDRGSLPIPEETSEERVERAMAVLEGRA